MAQVPWWRGNLPAETSGFIGHEREVRRLLKLLPGTSLITVTGSGGVGKSRIAVKAAERCRDSYPAGAWLVELSGEHNGDLLAHTVAAVLGLREQSARSQIEVLVEFLADKRLLLLLDGCEHLLAACRGLVAEILAAAPGVRIVVTSRQTLELPQETPLPVEPFETPEPEAGTPTANDALRFFLDRAGAAVPGLKADEATLAAAARICRRLDGIPLAIELAAGRLKTMTVERLADHLEERFDALYDDRALLTRHWTLRTAISWSHELCGPEERLLWARLSVFAGDFDAAAAVWVCGDRRLVNVRDLLADLVEKSLLIRVPGGYRQPGTVRDHGREQLARLDDEERLTRRHRYYYLDLARQADADWYGPRQEEWADRLNFSVTNLRLALDSDSPSTSLSIELAGTLWILWFCLGRLREGRYYMKRAIDAAPVTDPGLPRLLWTDGCVAIARGELELGRLRAEAALSAALDWGDYAAAGHAQLRLARRSLFAGSLDEVEPAVDLVREYFRKAEAVTVDEPIALVTLATAATWRGEFARVVSVLEEVQRLCDARGELWVRACGDYVLSIAQLGLGRAAEAAVAARQSLDVKWRLRDAAGVALALDQLAVIAAVEGDGHRTARLQGSAARLCDTFGLRGLGSKSVSEPRTVAERTARQLLGDDAYDAIFAEGHDDDLDSAMAYALG
ncbi:Predicted ATPase [Streptosporangium subroseum]|uniref:Predicted ATPase n=1 Tax=Streptosporangium subroseum TaxID=106412 RepID=A0A239LAJ3_9ACTN|nr:NB-ARC domain-containing protein [Streptosporangium subroseum]SNT26873.1 Predicted ATPase [Streptosporangium subroseum]